MPLPVTMLIDEHKLILQSIEVAKMAIVKIKVNKTISTYDIGTLVDFFRTYADRFHHGKEEGILFSELSRKQLSEDDKKLMNELIAEHVLARTTVTVLEQACKVFTSAKEGSLNAVEKSLETLINLYPAHIEKEDTSFFYPCMSYFSGQEQEDMMTKFREFNQNYTDKRYSQIIAALQKR